MKDKMIKELERLKPQLSELVYTITLNEVKHSSNSYKDIFDIIEYVERSLEPCPF